MAGRVSLIGAGPGDPELLTLRAVRALGECDVVLLDALVDRGVLAHCRPGVRVLDTGKRAGCRSTPQAFIERLMIRLARQGRVVGRIKGGDPFVFGRGGEEVEALRRAGVAVQVIPGITAGLGAAAALGMPLTHRALSRGVTLVSGHPAGVEPDWDALVRGGTTLVVYMGLRRVATIAAALLAAGMPPATPAVAVSETTRPEQRWLATTVGAMATEVARAGFRGPTLLVIGAVAELAKGGAGVDEAATDHARGARARVAG